MRLLGSICGRQGILAGLFLLVCSGLIGVNSPGVAANSAPASEKRVDAPFTQAVETPHVAWGRPWGGKPVHALVVPSVTEGRMLVELAERFPISYDTVMIDSVWERNTWTVGMGKDYGTRTYPMVYKYLAEDLSGSAHYDVIVLPSLFGWNRLPQDVRDAILKRVREGAGLVLIHPTTGIPAPGEPKVTQPLNIHAPEIAVTPGGALWQVSPLVDCLSDRLDGYGHLNILPEAVTGGAWKAVAQGFITDNVPFDSFPADYLKHYKYRLGPDSKLLIAGPAGEPIVAIKSYGKGRVVALGYVNHGLSPKIDWKFLGKQNDRWWEYFDSLLGRSIIWAAGKEPQITLLPMRVVNQDYGHEKLAVQLVNHTPVKSAEFSVRLANQWGDEGRFVTKPVRLKHGRNRFDLDVPGAASAGRNDVDVIISAAGKRYAWGSVSFAVPQSDRILSIVTDKEFYSLGDRLHVTVRLQGAEQQVKARVDVLDNYQRLIGSATEAASAGSNNVIQMTVPVGNYATNVGWVRVALLENRQGREIKIDQNRVRIDFAGLERKIGAYETEMPVFGPPSYVPWIPAVESQLRKVGVTVALGDPWLNFKPMSNIDAPGFGVYWYKREKYLEQKDNYLKTHDTSYLIREPDLSSHQWLDKLRGIITDSMKKDAPYRPLAYFLADESSLTAYGDPLDFSWSQPTLVAFRRWLTGRYSSLDSLNKEWETNYKAWDDVLPLTTSQAQAKGDYAGWIDHRTFMEQVYANAFQVAADTLKAEDPGGLPSISGTQSPGPSNAVNWYLLDHIVRYVMPYSGDDQDDLHRSIHGGQIMMGFTGYGNFGAGLRYQLWHRLLEGQSGLGLYSQYTVLNADLTRTKQGKELGSLTNELRNEGLALLLRGAERENCGIAVHYSLLSVRSHWITDGHIVPHEASDGDKTSRNLKRFHQNRTNWLQALRDAGYQYDFLTTEQIDKGNLPNYKVLILPDSISLSKTEAVAIRQFVLRGGLLITDGQPGLMDGHARWQKRGLLDDVLGVQHANMGVEAQDPKPVTLHVAWNGGEVNPVISPAEPQLKITSGKAESSMGSTPFLIENSFGAGGAVTLNFWLTNYDALRKAGANGPTLKLLEHYLNQAHAEPVADVRNAAGQSVGCSEIVGYRKGEVHYLAILPEAGCKDAGPVTVRFPSAHYVYNLREHGLLGNISRVQAKLADGEPLFLALSPEPVGKLGISAPGFSNETSRVEAGGAIAFQIRLSMPNGFSNIPEAVHVDVRNPDGKIVSYYGKNLLLKDGLARFSVALALNDEPGQWQVIVREPYSHQSAEANFTVTRPDLAATQVKRGAGIPNARELTQR
jgi:Beta-galactosidase trimerisation domain/Beta-galactosidase